MQRGCSGSFPRVFLTQGVIWHNYYSNYYFNSAHFLNVTRVSEPSASSTCHRCICGEGASYPLIIVHLVAVSTGHIQMCASQPPNCHRNPNAPWRLSKQPALPLRSCSLWSGAELALVNFNSIGRTGNSLKVRLCVLMEEIRGGTCFRHSIQGFAYCQISFYLLFFPWMIHAFGRFVLSRLSEVAPSGGYKFSH